jgi:hypothetical protein
MHDDAFETLGLGVALAVIVGLAVIGAFLWWLLA